MKSVLRLAFILPALLAAAPVCAQSTPQRPANIRYVTLDKMLHKFAAEARAQQAARATKPTTTTIASR